MNYDLAPSAIQALIAAGIVPKECYNFELTAKPGDVVRMRIDAHVSVDQFAVLVHALSKDRETLLSTAYVIFRQMVGDRPTDVEVQFDSVVRLEQENAKLREEVESFRDIRQIAADEQRNKIAELEATIADMRLRQHESRDE